MPGLDATPKGRPVQQNNPRCVLTVTCCFDSSSKSTYWYTKDKSNFVNFSPPDGAQVWFTYYIHVTMTPNSTETLLIDTIIFSGRLIVSGKELQAISVLSLNERGPCSVLCLDTVYYNS